MIIYVEIKSKNKKKWNKIVINKKLFQTNVQNTNAI